MPIRAPIEASPEPGSVQTIILHDGGAIRVRKLAADYDPHDRIRATTYLAERKAAGELVTGLLYVDAESADLHDALGTVDAPLNALPDAALVPGSAALAAINASLR
jgi:2-oxoglutarate ferredoxin oxidoreductase subunit beta